MAECPKEALASTVLKPGAKVVLAALWLRAGRDRRFVWPSRATLAADVGGASDRQLRRHLAHLESERWIVAERDRHGHYGWSLCDPPGTVVHKHESAPNATHDRPDKSVQTPVESDRTETSTRTNLSAEPAISDQRIPMESVRTNLRSPLELPSPVERAKTDVEAGASKPVGVNAWRSEFVWAWRAEFNQQATGGHTVQDPTSGARRIPELMRVLEEFGGQLVSDVLFHAGREVLRHFKAGGATNVGLHPGVLNTALRSDMPSFPPLLDAWQRDTRKKRTSGKLGASPAMLDGVTMDDDDQRVWMTAMGEDPEGAVRDARAARSVEGDTTAMFDQLVGSFGTQTRGEA